MRQGRVSPEPHPLFGPVVTATRRLWGRNGIWPAVLLGYACLAPRELVVDFSGAALFPYRLAAIILIPAILTRLAARQTRFMLADGLAMFVSVWPVVSLLVNDTIGTALITGGSQSLDFILSYLVGRAVFQNADDFRAFFILMLPGLLAIGGIMAIESLSHRIILRPFIADLVGRPVSFIYERARFGLMRATGPFPHPILGGVFLATVMPLAWYTFPIRQWRLLGIMASFAAIFTVSSTAVLALAVSAGMILVNELQRKNQLPLFKYGIILVSFVLLALGAVSGGNPIRVFIRYFTLDPATAFYRLLIWDYAGAEAVNHPIFGIGLRDWHRLPWMTDSVDSIWLFLAMRHGFPASVGLLALFVLVAVSLAIRSGRLQFYDRWLFQGLAISLAASVIAGFSVHFWEGLAAWLMQLLGIGASLVAGASVRRSSIQRRHLYPAGRTAMRSAR